MKVLDFGLAKAFEGASSRPTMSNSPTLMLAATAGLILGTAAYMTPEQARGRPADKRSDICAFGAVLYEMLTGKRAFDGDDISYTLANILKSEPDWNALPADTPPAVRRVLRRCLEKDPKRRTHDIADARLDLDEKDPTVAATPLPAKPRLLNLERVAVGAPRRDAGRSARVQPGAQTTCAHRSFVFRSIHPRMASSVPAAESDGSMARAADAISPDGTQLAFVATEKPERTQLWVRRIDAFTPRPLAGTENALHAVLVAGQPLAGILCRWQGEADRHGGRVHPDDRRCGGVPRGAAWGSGDVIVFSAGTPPRMARVSSRGGEVTILAGHWLAAGPPSFPMAVISCTREGLSDADGARLLLGSIEPAIEPRSLVASDSNGDVRASRSPAVRER